MLQKYRRKFEKNRIIEEEMKSAVSGAVIMSVRFKAKSYGIKKSYLERIVLKFKNAQADKFQT